MSVRVVVDVLVCTLRNFRVRVSCEWTLRVLMRVVYEFAYIKFVFNKPNIILSVTSRVFMVPEPGDLTLSHNHSYTDLLFTSFVNTC